VAAADADKTEASDDGSKEAAAPPPTKRLKKAGQQPASSPSSSKNEAAATKTPAARRSASHSSVDDGEPLNKKKPTAAAATAAAKKTTAGRTAAKKGNDEEDGKKKKTATTTKKKQPKSKREDDAMDTSCSEDNDKVGGESAGALEAEDDEEEGGGAKKQQKRPTLEKIVKPIASSTLARAARGDPDVFANRFACRGFNYVTSDPPTDSRRLMDANGDDDNNDKLSSSKKPVDPIQPYTLLKIDAGKHRYLADKLTPLIKTGVANMARGMKTPFTDRELEVYLDKTNIAKESGKAILQSFQSSFGDYSSVEGLAESRKFTRREMLKQRLAVNTNDYAVGTILIQADLATGTSTIVCSENLKDFLGGEAQPTINSLRAMIDSLPSENHLVRKIRGESQKGNYPIFPALVVAMNEKLAQQAQQLREKQAGAFSKQEELATIETVDWSDKDELDKIVTSDGFCGSAAEWAVVRYLVDAQQAARGARGGGGDDDDAEDSAHDM
jgi:hypothetical protein